MTAVSSSAAGLLADLGKRGIILQPVGAAIRYWPRSAMLPHLLKQLRTHKADLLAMAIIQQAHDHGDADLAERLAEAWRERIAMCVADGKVSRQMAEEIALQQLRMMSQQSGGRDRSRGE
jgi:hypothetical protein